MRLIFFQGLGLTSESFSIFVAVVILWEEDGSIIPLLHSDSVVLRKRAILEERGRRSRLHRARFHENFVPVTGQHMRGQLANPPNSLSFMFCFPRILTE